LDERSDLLAGDGGDLTIGFEVGPLKVVFVD
jgi:hypothetical protein